MHAERLVVLKYFGAKWALIFRLVSQNPVDVVEVALRILLSKVRLHRGIRLLHQRHIEWQKRISYVYEAFKPWGHIEVPFLGSLLILHTQDIKGFRKVGYQCLGVGLIKPFEFFLRSFWLHLLRCLLD